MVREHDLFSLSLSWLEITLSSICLKDAGRIMSVGSGSIFGDGLKDYVVSVVM